MVTHFRRDERGATAVLFALLSMTLLGAGALAVDMGQVYAKRSSLQSAVDQAALAAAAELDGSSTCTSGAVTAAEEYLAANWIDEDNDPFDADLDGSAADGDGFIDCTGWTVELWAPQAHVDFGLAKALDEDNTGLDVPARAQAGVFSPATSVMPAYAVQGCDYGPQTLLDDSGGSSTTPVATPSLPGGSTTTSVEVTTLNPSSIDLNAVSGLSVEGNNALENATHVGFSTPSSGSNLHHSVPVTTKAKKLATLTSIPSSVTGVQGLWYVRVSTNGGTAWSNALPLRVGPAMLECQAGSTSGNFGAVLAYRSPDPSTNDRLALNMALGLHFTVTSFPSPHSNWQCTHGTGGAVESTKTALRDGTNCFDTDTGLPAEATEKGLLTGDGIGVPGRLMTATNADCGRSNAAIDFGGSVGSRSLNNDILTCFFTNGTTRISDLGSGYSGGEVISEDIFTSPRFYWVPVFGTQPASGGSNRYQIVDFRPAFITDQATDATRDNPQVDAGGTQNGLGLKEAGGKKTLRSVKVVFFDADALPQSMAGGPVMTYLGVGTKVITLTD